MSEINDYKIEIVKIISAGTTKIQEIVAYDKQPSKGYPLITVTISESENKFESNATNKRIFIFRIMIYDQISNNVDVGAWNSAVERAESNLSDIVSEILGVLDNNFTLNGIVDYVEATPSNWGYMETEKGFCRTAEILLRVNKSYLVA